MKKILLDIKNLVTEFQSGDTVVKAANNISFQLCEGETIGIVGESGSGKSVTSLSAMQLIPNPPGRISNGEILFHHNNTVVDLVKLSEKEMRTIRGNEIAMIFQEPMTSLNPVFTCGNQVAEAIVLHQKVSKKEARLQAIELFKKVYLPRPEAIFDSYPHQISGGQKQRVMIAMALSCNPSILIADEPTTALDVTVQKEILVLMKQLQKEFNMGILFITHDLGVIAELADKIVVMYKGNIVEQGNAKEVFNNPKHPYTKGLLACRPTLTTNNLVLPTVSDYMQVGPTGELIEKEFDSALFTNTKPIFDTEHKKTILSVTNLVKQFPIKKNFWGKAQTFVNAVDDVTFDVYEGETLGLVGESGCGKTTLGRCILRLIEPTSGNIVYRSSNIMDYTKSELQNLRKEAQIIFQDPYSSLNPRISIGEAIIEPMRVHGILANEKERKAQVIELLERVSLSGNHYNRFPHEFSGGQRQRICIARSLALKPKFIICDESVSALDVSVQAQVLNLLNELKQEFKLTYIFISHDLSVVKFMSDRIVVMNKGKIEEMGNSEEIYRNPQSAYTKKLIESIPTG